MAADINMSKLKLGLPHKV